MDQIGLRVGGCWNGMYMEASEGMVMVMASKSMGDLHRRMAAVVIELKKASQCLGAASD